MAKVAQQKLFLILGDAYQRAVMTGAVSVELHIGWLADILEYLDGTDNSERKVGKQFDDFTNEEWEKIGMPRVSVPEKAPEVHQCDVCQVNPGTVVHTFEGGTKAYLCPPCAEGEGVA